MIERRMAARATLSVASYFLAPMGLVILLAFLGVPGLEPALPFGSNLLFWALVICTNWVLCDLAIQKIDATLRPDLFARSYAVPLVGSLVVLVPQIGVVLFCLELFSQGRYTFDPVMLTLRVAGVSAVLSVLLFNLGQQTPPGGTYTPSDLGTRFPASRDSTPATSKLRRKLSSEVGGNILWVRSEDHYLRVTSAQGQSALVLGKLSDVAREFSREGVQVHRSWWVAHRAVMGVTYGSSSELALSDGTTVPVGRSFLAQVRACGFQETNDVNCGRQAEQT
ncbi:hypothetical protein So717_33590 [Roseobacter cerasinus]|uniref:HTH LytTR-type domain-containing protein n=1 Tax=Roseobacter cerasinus TaxID=2602289 RepID=A0A640VZB5_9RHOB|nr:LytTR family transcriptional regulator DNA-binding domain-containing protein [Roseobacter cerasinus]GFE51606.1 hypothetical protein So717_33590 [Roseobacter cerasinus]